LSTEDFAARARAFVEFVDRAAALALPDRLRAVRAQLLDVYTAALSLPHIESADDVDEQTSPMPPRLDFGAHDEYWEAKPNHGSARCPRRCRRLRRSRPRARAVDRRQARRRGLGFDVHWGDHAVDALRALHRACNPNR
jgi:hypothetical protein